MQLTAFKKRLQHDSNNDHNDRKLIKSVLDIINPPDTKPSESKTGSTEQFNEHNSPQDKPKIVLHVDDDPDDREFVNYAIKSVDPSFIVHEAHSGQAGINFLQKAKSLGNLPCLIILDINMPGMNGFDAYNEIKKDDALRAIPTVIFTTAAVFKANQNEGNEHLPIFIKPDNSKDFVTSIRKILTHCKE
jgi:CheY-like chemotaxis protein